jgi:hypothetical protein
MDVLFVQDNIYKCMDYVIRNSPEDTEVEPETEIQGPTLDLASSLFNSHIVLLCLPARALCFVQL